MDVATAVHVDGCARNVGRQIGCQKQTSAGEIQGKSLLGVKLDDAWV